MSRCTCHGASPEPCDWCQWAEEYHPDCGERYDVCDCSQCEACGDYCDHDTVDHKFEQDELWCWEKFGCLEVGEHYHRDEIIEMRRK